VARIAAVSLGIPRSLMSNRGSPASIRAAISATGPQPGDLVRVAGEYIVSEQPSGFASNVAGGGDEDHLVCSGRRLVCSQMAVRPPSTWMIAPLM
jgi:hypothetical protein